MTADSAVVVADFVAAADDDEVDYWINSILSRLFPLAALVDDAYLAGLGFVVIGLVVVVVM